jgi:CheY-like chemotaxis protein
MASILVVDDDADIRLLARLTLERDGHEVTVAAGGEEALQAVVDSPPDVVVLDVMMPGVDGYAVLRKLKGAGSDLSAIPVIILTALGGPMDRAKGAIEGAVRYLTKPIDLDELRRAVLDALSGPEGPQRKAAQRHALEMLARMERNASSADIVSSEPRPRLSGLERERTTVKTVAAPPKISAERVAALTQKQRALLASVAGSPTIMEAASCLQMSRSNVYASLRRISRNLGTRGVADLLELLRSGDVPLDACVADLPTT